MESSWPEFARQSRMICFAADRRVGAPPWQRHCNVPRRAWVKLCGGRGRGGGGGLDELYVIGREHSKVSVWTVAPPPAFVYHLDPGDDVIGVEGDLCVVSWRKGAAAHELRVVLTLTPVKSDIRTSNFHNVYMAVLQTSQRGSKERAKVRWEFLSKTENHVSSHKLQNCNYWAECLLIPLI